MRYVRALFIILLVIAIGSPALLPGRVFADTTSSNPNANVAAAVQSYFADIPIMIAIAKCESGPRQFANDGSPLFGGNGFMVGVFQIDRNAHYAGALALGFDIDTLNGNMEYARYLYGAQGTDPWISSFNCWNASAATSSIPLAASTSTQLGVNTTPVLTLNLTLGSIDPQVLILQQLLNQAGFTLAASGPGSPGNETTKFGALTYAALKKFQCAQGIACSGEEATTGYGFLNGVSRAALLAVTSPVPIAMASSSSLVSSTDSTSSSEANPIQVALVASSSTATVITAIAASTGDNALEIAELNSRVAALIVIVNELETEIAAKFGPK